MLMRLGRWLSRSKTGSFVAPPVTGDGTQWDFRYAENSAHLMTCGVM